MVIARLITGKLKCFITPKEFDKLQQEHKLDSGYYEFHATQEECLKQAKAEGLEIVEQ